MLTAGKASEWTQKTLFWWLEGLLESAKKLKLNFEGWEEGLERAKSPNFGKGRKVEF